VIPAAIAVGQPRRQSALCVISGPEHPAADQAGRRRHLGQDRRRSDQVLLDEGKHIGFLMRQVI